MKKKEVTAEAMMSQCRQRMQELAGEYQSMAEALLGRGPLVRGTVNWNARAGGRYPGLTRGEGGKVVGRRIRLEHLEWLGPLLERHKAYRQAQARMRELHREAMELADTMRQARLYDYEPRAEGSAYVVKAKGVRHGA